MSDDRERACDVADVPPGIAPLVAGYRWARDTVGESGGAVYRLHDKDGAPDLYLKHGRGEVGYDVMEEMARLRWLGWHIPVPAVAYFAATEKESWLLTTALRGRTAYQWLADGGDRAAVVDAVARFLRRLHAIPVETCPFNSDQRLRLAEARARMDGGLVDTADFDEARQGWSARRVWDAMTGLLPFAEDRVVTHGDFSLDNILIKDGEVTGLIDVGRAGIADRYQDLGIVWHCLGEFGAALQERLFERYGAAADAGKIAFHVMLDEFF